MKNRILTAITVLFTFSLFSNIFAQDEIELFLIDSYVTPEAPYEFRISFFVSEAVSAEIVFDQGYKYVVSEEPLEDFSAKYDFNDVEFDSATAIYNIFITTSNGKKIKSGPYELVLPFFEQKIETEQSLDIFTTCCIGGAFFGMPSFTVAQFDDESHLGLNKEIPLLTISKTGLPYPDHIFSLEYAFIYDIENKHHLRAGYKYLYQPGGIEYLSGGVSGFTDFNGFNGVGAEASIGWFKFYGIFAVYTKYRFNVMPGNTDNKFHEFSIGLFSDFFSYHL